VTLKISTLHPKSRDSSVGIALGYGMDDRGSRVRFPARTGNFSLHHAFRTALGPTQPPIQWVPGSLSLEVKRPGREADHSPLSSAKVKECVELYLHSPNTNLPLPIILHPQLRRTLKREFAGHVACTEGK
jgi:hypothetical protein